MSGEYPDDMNLSFDFIYIRYDMSMNRAKVLLMCMFMLLPHLLKGEDLSNYRRTSAQKGVGVSTDVAVIALPVATLAGVLVEQDWEGLKQGALTAVTTAGATLILKYAIKEERPDHSNRHSFPSGHTSAAFSTATFLQRRYGWKFGVPAYAVATYIGWGRVFSKKHHWWDVVAGAAIGAGSAFIYTTPFARDHALTVSGGSEGVSLCFEF